MRVQGNRPDPGYAAAVLERLDGPAVNNWCAAALTRLRRARAEIDALNVYPVPDGDTGTNLVATMEAVVAALAGGPAVLSVAAKEIAHAALLGARGNSGVILSQLLRGFADEFGSCDTAGPDELRQALRRAAEQAYLAVAEPVEGTILSVARAAAEAAGQSGTGGLAEVAAAALRGAAAALERTPEQLPVLAQAGVVDAGGRGLVVLLEALAAVVSGSDIGEAPTVAAAAEAGPERESAGGDGQSAALAAGASTGTPGPTGGPAFEVQYLLDAPADAIPDLKAALLSLGDSVLVVGGERLWSVHAHVDDVGAAIEAGLDAGRPHRITVTHFESSGRGRPRASAVVAVAAGPALANLFSQAGALVVQHPEGLAPSTSDLLGAIRESDSTQVVLLPNDGDIRAVADAAAGLARDEGRKVAVIPTRSPVQGLAAIAVHDAQRRFDDNVIAMSSAAGATRWGQVTRAARDSQTSAGRCRPGDLLGLIEGSVCLVAPGVGEAARGLLDRLLIGGGELVTLITGADADAELVDELRAYLSVVRPAVEVVAYHGGQPHHPLLVGVE
jgi:DAK2 domain fusion protein YloV